MLYGMTAKSRQLKKSPKDARIKVKFRYPLKFQEHYFKCANSVHANNSNDVVSSRQSSLWKIYTGLKMHII